MFVANFNFKKYIKRRNGDTTKSQYNIIASVKEQKFYIAKEEDEDFENEFDITIASENNFTTKITFEEYFSENNETITRTEIINTRSGADKAKILDFMHNYEEIIL